MKEIKIGLAGLGTVGSGVARLLSQNANQIEIKNNLKISIATILDLDFSGKESIIPANCQTTNNLEDFFKQDFDILVELIGGKTIARQIIEKALQSNKNIVTANKALLAEHGNTLFALAKQKQCKILFEAAVGGAIPIIQTITNSLSHNNIKKIDGILNGTSNYILTRMYEERLAYTEILPQAQKLGFAEADPSFDVDGNDAAHKIAILANLAFGSYVPYNKIFKQGIRNISIIDIDLADKMGFMIKPLSIAKVQKKGIEVRVHPVMIRKSHPLAAVRLENNGIFYEGDFAGPGSLFGKGAGSFPTASAVVADIIQLAHGNISPLVFSDKEKLPIVGLENIESKFYLRLDAEDKPGILSKIAGILGDNQISIASVLQLESNGNRVPLTMTTHKANALNMEHSLNKITELPEIMKEFTLLHIEE